MLGSGKVAPGCLIPGWAATPHTNNGALWGTNCPLLTESRYQRQLGEGACVFRVEGPDDYQPGPLWADSQGRVRFLVHNVLVQ